MKRAVQMELLKMLTFGWRLIEDSPAAAILERPLLSRWKERLLDARRPYDAMSSDTVIKLLDGFASIDVPVWVIGGWGLDALLGRQSRSHSDLDLLVAADSQILGRALTMLSSLGYSRQFEEAWPAADDPMTRRLVAANNIGQSVDLHPVDLSGPTFSTCEPDAAATPTTLTTGQLGGRTVPCVSAEFHLAQKRFHEQREPLSAKDHRDIAMLQAFAISGSEGVEADVPT